MFIENFGQDIDYNNMVDEYGENVTNALKNNSETDKINAENMNQQLISSIANWDDSIQRSSENILKNTTSINNQNNALDEKMLQIKKISNESDFIKRKLITSHKKIEDTEQKNIYAKHIYSVLIIVNILLFVYVLALLRK